MELSINTGKKELRQFGLLMGGVIAGIFGILIPLIKGKSVLLPALVIGAVFFLAAGIAPRILAPIYRAWMVLGHILGWINSRIILGAIFFIMFVPVSIVLRLIGRDAMARHLDKKLVTYRVKKPYDRDIGSGMERPF